MRSVRPLALAVALAAVAALATGCADDTKQSNAYVDAVNRAQTEFAATFDKLSRKITSTSTTTEDRRTLDGFQAAIDAVVADLRAVDAPDSVQGLHARLVQQMAGYGQEIQRAKTAFRSSDPDQLLKAQTDLVTAVTAVSTRINATIEQINRKLRE
jgi:type IV pilus biogenesis protein CpaD/CtpE